MRRTRKSFKEYLGLLEEVPATSTANVAGMPPTDAEPPVSCKTGYKKKNKKANLEELPDLTKP